MAKRRLHEFKKKQDLYEFQEDTNPKFVEIGEYQVPLPKAPKRSDMENFEKSRRQQIFKRNVIPRDLKYWDKRDQRAYVEAEFHKRKHGVWYLINNKPIYLTGKAYVFFNYWNIEAGGLPEFRMEAVEWFLLWDMIERDPNCYGVVDIKARRIGDTEKALFLLWEYATRVRRSWCGMQNIKEDDAKDNYKRLLSSHTKMPFFFQPRNKGSEEPETALEFRFPPQTVSRKSLREEVDEQFIVEQMDSRRPPLESRIDYETTKLKRYDGKRLGRYHMDEPGKMTEMDPVKQWAILKPTMHLYSGKVVIGKAIFTTTVENFKDGQTMDNAKKLWDGANPNERDMNGRTANGLYRIFRSALLTAQPDRFGFHKKQELEEMIMNERDNLIKKGWLDDYADLCRKQPITIDDVFTLPANECVLHPALLDERLRQIREKVNPYGEPYKPRALKYDLVWKNGVFGDEVEAIPSPSGRWTISQMPVRPNYRMGHEYYNIPGNLNIYTMGVDPVDHASNKGKGSDFAFAVYRRYSEEVDGGLTRDDRGMVVDRESWKMETDQFVCAYSFRAEDPVEGYEDCFKTAVFFGVPFLFESQKPGIRTWLYGIDNKRYKWYVKNRPDPTKITTNNYQASDGGVPASTKVINMYVDALKYHIKHRYQNYHHVDQLEDFRRFKVTNRTERDLTVASGFALIDAFDNILQIQEEQKEQWVEPLWKKYKAA